MSDVTKVTVFINNMSMLDDIHQGRSEFFTPPYPASSLVQVVARGVSKGIPRLPTHGLTGRQPSTVMISSR